MIRVLPAVLSVAVLTGCAQPTTTATVPSQPRAPTSGIPPYHREAFGGWATVRGNCDTREIVMERDAGPAAVDTDGDGCRDNSPVLDVYTGRIVDPAHIDVDHVYPLKLAWENGAWRWTPQQRHDFANDPGNLRAVCASINRSKADLSPSQWKPPARRGWCYYARIFRATASRWHLEISTTDDAALRAMEATC